MKILLLALSFCVVAPAAMAFDYNGSYSCKILHAKGSALAQNQTLIINQGVGYLRSRPGQRFFVDQIGPGIFVLLDGERGDDFMLKCRQ